ncbi:LMBR1 domain-containing protein 2 A-like protein isoform X1 [Cinnamomum micranthum f. kanehirae]|uniref:LMBR1 domain-containing protein 2 A-like protein isoform X1 n=1 Tax=Cinnamomum micranthum f. kanehirae TaxID=337451 RepID=A0A443PNV7_9MAGN|nr:LMBR1 domain-containing protein 2 A-like protein isoform X1 [Cinnamomum micranthum f. kanehirae]
MWLFYLISLPLTLGMVAVTLRYFAGPDVPRYVLLTVGYTWFCSISIIILVPADIWTTIIDHEKGGISFLWSWSYWSTFVLTWVVVPAIQGYEDAGDFTVTERLKTSLHANLIFYLSVGSIGLFGLVLLIIMHKIWSEGIVGLAMACSNTFGLVTGAFLLGFGLSEIPKGIWRNSDWSNRQKVLSHRIAKMAVRLDNAHQELSNAIVVAQATSNQMSRRDPLRPCMDVIDSMLIRMFKEDPSFKPSGGRLGDNDMDYDTDEKSMATLRRQLRIAREEYCRYKSEYKSYVMEALELEDTIKSYECRYLTGWKYVSSFRVGRTGKLGPFLDTTELIWRCILRKHLAKLLAIILGCMSAAILLAEATLLPSGVHLSLFSLLINAGGKEEVLVQIAAFVPLMYMCIGTYYSLFKVGMLMFYSLTPRQTCSVSLLMICSMVARYAPPISYNFLNLIRLDGNAKTIFEKRMGNIDDAVPFFGKGFNKIYPLIMVVYTLLVASNFFDRVLDFLGSWRRFRFQNEVDDIDGFDSAGVIIMQKERSLLEQGRKVGEHVIPLVRNLNSSSIDVEPGITTLDKGVMEMKATTSLADEGGNVSRSKPSREENRRYGNISEAIGNKYSSIMREQRGRYLSTASTASDTNLSSARVALLNADNSSDQYNSNRIMGAPSSGLSKTWASMKTSFQSFKASVGAKKSLPQQQVQEANFEPLDSESLDEIFQNLQQKTSSDRNGDYCDDDDNLDVRHSGWKR